jgi:hypothetical protein
MILLFILFAPLIFCESIHIQSDSRPRLENLAQVFGVRGVDGCVAFAE